MRETRSSGSVEGVMSNRDPYSDLALGFTFNFSTFYFLVRLARYCVFHFVFIRAADGIGCLRFFRLREGACFPTGPSFSALSLMRSSSPDHSSWNGPTHRS